MKQREGEASGWRHLIDVRQVVDDVGATDRAHCLPISQSASKLTTLTVSVMNDVTLTFRGSVKDVDV